MAPRRYIGGSGRVYEPIDRIGPGGGFGSVERVRDGDGKTYALKTLHIGIDEAVLSAEAQNLRRVQHENVVRYVDQGSDPEPFLVMELANDGTLKDYIAAAQQRGEHFPVETIVDWARQLLWGLEAIHEVLVHRDLKPGDVVPAILDPTWGLERMIGAIADVPEEFAGPLPRY
jgi:serine/threonine protein kinase